MNESSFDPVWEDVFQKQEWGAYPSEHVIRFVARNFYSAPNRRAVRLLDLGSGPGACTWYMAREGFSVSAIDGSTTGIERLKRRLAAERLEVDARVGDIVRLPWENGSFDGVVDNAAICCNRFQSCKRIVAEVARVLKPGGVFCSAGFTDRSWGYGLGTQVEAGGFDDIQKGPLSGKGFCLFTSRAQVDELFADWSDKVVDRISWTLGGEAHQQVEMWVVTARKVG